MGIWGNVNLAQKEKRQTIGVASENIIRNTTGSDSEQIKEKKPLQPRKEKDELFRQISTRLETQ
jgi:hypothetical protein